MLGEVTSEELTEWVAYFKVKENHSKNEQAAAEAKRRAEANNR